MEIKEIKDMLGKRVVMDYVIRFRTEEEFDKHYNPNSLFALGEAKTIDIPREYDVSKFLIEDIVRNAGYALIDVSKKLDSVMKK